MIWTPISLDELTVEINKGESKLQGELLTLWNMLKIRPEKWTEETYGKEGDGFWAVGIIGKKVIYYNDIEDGFNISNFKEFGIIEDYFCNKDELNWTVRKLHDSVKFGSIINNQLGPPEPLDLK